MPIHSMSDQLANRKTIFDNETLTRIFRRVSFAVFRWRGWKLVGAMPDLKKCVIIGAPHTSNWDFPIALGLAFCFHVRFFWIGKHTLFRWPFGGLMRWLGGIPVNRTASQNLVAQSANFIRASERIQLGIPPDGTRKSVRAWKTGFYYIAQQAEVPIVLAFIDFKSKECGFGPTFMPTGDIEKDMAEMRAFYAPIESKIPGRLEAIQSHTKSS